MFSRCIVCFTYCIGKSDVFITFSSSITGVRSRFVYDSPVYLLSVEETVVSLSSEVVFFISSDIRHVLLCIRAYRLVSRSIVSLSSPFSEKSVSTTNISISLFLIGRIVVLLSRVCTLYRPIRRTVLPCSIFGSVANRAH